MSVEEFSSSSLGTKEHWEAAYEDEIQQFNESGDPGEVWFGFKSVERVVNWIASSQLVSRQSTIVDLGCGNGITLVELHKKGFSQLLGVDYVQSAVNLANAIARKKGVCIEYKVCDILADKSCWPGPLSDGDVDVCVDKGTYDAISLHPTDPAQRRSRYVESVASMLKDAGLLVLTCCNWTRAELGQHFQKRFTFVEEVPTPSFSFGGHSGNKETVLILQKS